MDYFVLRCTNNGKYSGKYVAKPNSNESYTSDISKMQVFRTKEDALKNACGNEYPVNLENLLQGLKKQ